MVTSAKSQYLLVLLVFVAAFDGAQFGFAANANSAISVRKLDTSLMFGAPVMGGRKILLKEPDPRAVVTKERSMDGPRQIQDRKTLDAVIRNKEICDRVDKNVNFDAEQLVLIAWDGPASERVAFRVNGQALEFYEPPMTQREVSKFSAHHVHLYAISKGTKWSFEKSETPKAITVRQLDSTRLLGPKPSPGKKLVDHRAIMVKGRAKDKPITIGDSKNLAKVITDEKLYDRIVQEVDFDSEQLIFFAWKGSPTEGLAVQVKDRQVNLCEFQFLGNRINGDRFNNHIYFYVINKATKWQYRKPPNPPRCPGPNQVPFSE